MYPWGKKELNDEMHPLYVSVSISQSVSTIKYI